VPVSPAKRLVQYVEAEKQIATEKKCQIVDLHSMFLAALKQKPASEKGNWLTSDGVHMKPLGDAIMASGVLMALGVPDNKLSGSDKPSAAKTSGGKTINAALAFHLHFRGSSSRRSAHGWIIHRG